jgi:hypothetical protein
MGSWQLCCRQQPTLLQAQQAPLAAAQQPLARQAVAQSTRLTVLQE